jgi:hypothetical protein
MIQEFYGVQIYRWTTMGMPDCMGEAAVFEARRSSVLGLPDRDVLLAEWRSFLSDEFIREWPSSS